MPSILKYKEAITMKPSAFKSLSDAEFDKSLYFITSRALLLKGRFKEKDWGFKFFVSTDNIRERYIKLSEMELNFIPKSQFLDNEIRIIENSSFVSQPVLMSEWLEGDVLSNTIKTLCQNNDYESLTTLRNKVIDLFIELLSTEIIHGDLKFENIIVSKTGDLFIIDWDSYYVPSLKEYPSMELGTYSFQHPSRTQADYGCRVDDYSIALIIVTLFIYSEQPSLYGKYHPEDAILLVPDDIIRGRSRIYTRIAEAWQYLPSRCELLRFLAGDSYELHNLKNILLRMSGRVKFNPEKEELVDKKLKYKRIINKITKLYGYIDEDENVIIDTIYGDCTALTEEITGVRINSQWYFIDKKGTQISEVFQKISDCENGLFPIKMDNQWQHFSAKERKIIQKI